MDEDSPTITDAFTQPGTILGTAAYMAPEQARGKHVDKRVDIWAFGYILFECISGKRAFRGDDVTDTLAAIIRGEPEWSALPKNVPATIQLLLRKCLAKDRRRRLPDIAAAKIDLEEALENPTSSFIQWTDGALVEQTDSRSSAFSRNAGWVVALLMMVLCIIFWKQRTTDPAKVTTSKTQVTRFDYEIPEDHLPLKNNGRPVLAVSPDGQSFVYNGQNGLYRRMLNQLKAVKIPGTEKSKTNPFFSHDGKSVGYRTEGYLVKIPITGGAFEPICEIDNPFGIHWGPDDVILYGQEDGIWRVSAQGKDPELLIKAKEDEIFHGPQLLPDKDTVLLTSAPKLDKGTAGDWDNAAFFVYSITQEKRIPLLKGHSARYVEQPGQTSGHLIFAVENTLYGVAFDDKNATSLGAPINLIEGVHRARVADGIGIANYDISKNGHLFYVASLGEDLYRLIWIDRKGQKTPLPTPPGMYDRLSIARDQDRIALDERNSTDDLWVWDGISKTIFKLNAGPSGGRYPVWDSQETGMIAFTGGVANRDISWRAANNTGEPGNLVNTREKFDKGNPKPLFFTSDGDQLVVQINYKFAKIGVQEGSELDWLLEDEKSGVAAARLSPNGRWMAYMVDVSESYGTESYGIYVRPFPDLQSDRIKVSTAGGVFPTWSHDGKELIYLELSGEEDRLMIAKVEDPDASQFTFETPTFFMDWPRNRGQTLTLGKTAASWRLNECLTSALSALWWLKIGSRN